jgi:outer membrane biosynthesis protein TonB
MPIVILALLLQLSPAKLVTVVPPNPPLNAIAGTCVLADVAVDIRGSVGEVTILQGTGAFRDSATGAIRQWKFSAARENNQSKPSRVGVLTVFRPAAIGNSSVGGPSLGYKQPTPTTNNHPPLPRSILDPGYPQNSTSNGVVILELTIDRKGVPSSVRTIRDVPSLTEVSREAIRSWSFMPAVESGEPVEGTLVVVFSFLRPVQ